MASSLCCRNIQSIRINYTIASKILYKKPFAHYTYFDLGVNPLRLRLRRTNYFNTYDEAADYKKRLLNARDAPGTECVCDSSGDCSHMQLRQNA